MTTHRLALSLEPPARTPRAFRTDDGRIIDPGAAGYTIHPPALRDGAYVVEIETHTTRAALWVGEGEEPAAEVFAEIGYQIDEGRVLIDAHEGA